MTTTQQYAERFPSAAREAAKCLSSDNHFAILALLIREEGQSFNQIKEAFEDLHQQSISNVLSRLQEGGLIVRKELVTDSSSYSTQYEVTTLGQNVLTGLLDAVEPRKEQPTHTVHASGHEYHTAEAPYLVTTSSMRNVSSGKMEDATQVGGLRGERPTGNAPEI